MKLGIGREEQDEVGMESYRRAERARDAGVFEKEVVGVTVRRGREEVLVMEDEEVGRCDYKTFRQTRCYWGETVGGGAGDRAATGGRGQLEQAGGRRGGRRHGQQLGGGAATAASYAPIASCARGLSRRSFVR